MIWFLKPLREFAYGSRTLPAATNATGHPGKEGKVVVVVREVHVVVVVPECVDLVNEVVVDVPDESCTIVFVMELIVLVLVVVEEMVVE